MARAVRFYIWNHHEKYDFFDTETKKTLSRREYDLGMSFADFLYVPIEPPKDAGDRGEVVEILDTLYKSHVYFTSFGALAELMRENPAVPLDGARLIAQAKNLQFKMMTYMSLCLQAGRPPAGAPLIYRHMQGFLSPSPVQQEQNAAWEYGLVSPDKGIVPAGTMPPQDALLLPIYAPRSPADFARAFGYYFALNHMAFKKCKHCGRFFLPAKHAGAEYCSRTISGSTKTCREMGAIRLYNAKKADDPISQAYNRAYKKRHAWIRYHKCTEAHFKEWSAQARLMRDACRGGTVTLADFIQWLESDQNAPIY